MWPACDIRYDCDDDDKIMYTTCSCHEAGQACDAMDVQREREDWWGTCDWIGGELDWNRAENIVANRDGTYPSSPLECIAMVKEQFPAATIAKTRNYGTDGCWAQYGSSKPVVEDGSGYRSCVLASVHEPQDLRSFKFVDIVFSR